MHINYFVSVVGLAAAVLSPHAWSQPVEPGAGGWKTWVISSGKDYRVLPPPGVEETQGELNALADLLAHGDAGTRDVAAYWDAGAPTYRWMDYLNNRIMANTPTTGYAHRVYAYMALAMYDATIAAWESKYAYNRARPSVADNRVKPLVDVRRARRIHPSILRRRRRRQPCSPISCPTKPPDSKRPPSRPAGRASWRASNTRPIT